MQGGGHVQPRGGLGRCARRHHRSRQSEQEEEADLDRVQPDRPPDLALTGREGIGQQPGGEHTDENGGDGGGESQEDPLVGDHPPSCGGIGAGGRQQGRFPGRAADDHGEHREDDEGGLRHDCGRDDQEEASRPLGARVAVVQQGVTPGPDLPPGSRQFWALDDFLPRVPGDGSGVRRARGVLLAPRGLGGVAGGGGDVDDDETPGRGPRVRHDPGDDGLLSAVAELDRGPDGQIEPVRHFDGDGDLPAASRVAPLDEEVAPLVDLLVEVQAVPIGGDLPVPEACRQRGGDLGHERHLASEALGQRRLRRA